ncbi:Mu transposase C-terminal domain-containing protein [Methylobacter luteus]|uniref:Mu transposase C-terminal domain-containing protein n=1 Tax=Methylobacter luteus TaxID=415 RepID=UPI00041CDCC9|nr:Mu transposase C-terminal domain-containing protein [Methylobacter luteus]
MTDLSQIAEPEWHEAQRRAEIVRPLVESKCCSRLKAREAAAELGLSERQIYRLIQRLRESGGELTALLPGGSNGGRGKQRLAESREHLLRRLIAEIFVTRQKRSAAELVFAVRSQCLKAGLDPPSESTIRRRLRNLSLAEHRQRGELHPETKPVYGSTPIADTPLDWLQMDHTPVDLIIVDPIDRSPIGRPWITVAIDVFSRCIAGFHLSLEAPSATSVGLCLTLVASDKVSWLQQRGIEAHWPIVGKPCRIGVDNASEFHSAAFERGCAQHGIAIEWRPPGQPHFGGIIERIIGTLMQLVHALPGTTFSNPSERGDYDSDKRACLTLEELERWLAVAITKYYHLRPHEGLEGEIPLRRYEQGLQALTAANKTLPLPRDPRTFLIDFLPVVRRSLQRDGITIDHITYYSNALRPWIKLRNQPTPFMIRRDPRDLSRIFVLDAEHNGYLEVPYRTLSRPAITLWEHKLARKRLREQRRTAADEASLFAAIDEMRDIERKAKALTRTARRNRTRRQIALKPESAATPAERSTSTVDVGPVRPFDDIELW